MGRQFIIFLSLLCLISCKSKTSSSKSSTPSPSLPVCGTQLALQQDSNPPPPNVPVSTALAAPSLIDQLTVSATVNWIDDSGMQNLLVTAQAVGSIPSLEDRVADFPRFQICDSGSPAKCLTRVNGKLTSVAKSDDAYIDFHKWAGILVIPPSFSGTLFVKVKGCTYVRASNAAAYAAPTGSVLCNSMWTNADPSPLSRTLQKTSGQCQLDIDSIKEQIKIATTSMVAPSNSYLELINNQPQNEMETGLVGVAKGILRDPGITSAVIGEGLLDNFASQATQGSTGATGLALADSSCADSNLLPTPPLNSNNDIASTVTTTTTATTTATSITTSVTTQTVNNTATMTTTTTQMAVSTQPSVVIPSFKFKPTTPNQTDSRQITQCLGSTDGISITYVSCDTAGTDWIFQSLSGALSQIQWKGNTPAPASASGSTTTTAVTGSQKCISRSKDNKLSLIACSSADATQYFAASAQADGLFIVKAVTVAYGQLDVSKATESDYAAATAGCLTFGTALNFNINCQGATEFAFELPLPVQISTSEASRIVGHAVASSLNVETVKKGIGLALMSMIVVVPLVYLGGRAISNTVRARGTHTLYEDGFKFYRTQTAVTQAKSLKFRTDAPDVKIEILSADKYKVNGVEKDFAKDKAGKKTADVEGVTVDEDKLRAASAAKDGAVIVTDDKGGKSLMTKETWEKVKTLGTKPTTPDGFIDLSQGKGAWVVEAGSTKPKALGSIGGLTEFQEPKKVGAFFDSNQKLKVGIASLAVLGVSTVGALMYSGVFQLADTDSGNRSSTFMQALQTYFDNITRLKAQLDAISKKMAAGKC